VGIVGFVGFCEEVWEEILSGEGEDETQREVIESLKAYSVRSGRGGLLRVFEGWAHGDRRRLFV
jgi:hypothetical protein